MLLADMPSIARHDQHVSHGGRICWRHGVHGFGSADLSAPFGHVGRVGHPDAPEAGMYGRA